MTGAGPNADRSDELPARLGAATLCAVLIAAPLLQGLVDPTWRATTTAVLCATGCLGLLAMLARGTRLELPPGSVPLLLFVALVVVQTLPIATTPSVAARDALGVRSTGHLSLVPGLTGVRLRECLGWLVCFCGASIVLRQPHRIRRLPWIALLLSTVLAVAFIADPFLQVVPAHVAADPDAGAHVFGTYLNRNHLAAFFALATIAGAGLLINRHRTLHHGSPGFGRRQGYIVVMLFASGAGVLMAGSRGALLGLVLGLSCLGALLAWRDAHPRRFVPLFAVVVFVGIAGLTLPEELARRFQRVAGDLSMPGARADLWQGAADLFALFPVFGTGLGTYPQLSVLTQPETVAGHIEHAHCDLLEYLVETGVVGVNFLLLAALGLGLHLARRARRARGDRRTVHACAAAAALLAVCVHALVDFDLQIPGLVVWLAVLGGAASGAMANAHDLPPRGWVPPRWTLAPAAVALALAALGAGLDAWAHHHLHAGATAADPAMAMRHLATAHRLRPDDGAAATGLARALQRKNHPAGDPATVFGYADLGLRANPFDRRAWHAMALVLLQRPELGDPGNALERTVALTPPGARPALRVALGLAILDAGAPARAAAWFRALFAARDDPATLLVELHRQAPPDLDLAPLIPPDAGGLLREYAELLLHAGAFARREQVLDLALRRAHRAGRLTVREAVSLTEHEVVAAPDTDRLVHVRLRFEVPARATLDEQPMFLVADGPGGRFQRAFTPVAGTTLFDIALPAWLPPGRYRVSLRPCIDGVRFPLGEITLTDRRLHLTPGVTLEAEDAFYRVAQPWEPRERDARGFRVTPATRLFRRLRLPGGGELVLTCAGTAALDVRLDGATLEPVGSGRLRRYALPDGVTAAELQIRAAGGAVETVHRIALVLGGLR